MEPVRAFLDSNILFSAALGGPAFSLLWELATLGKVALVTSRFCIIEAEVNLKRKAPSTLDRYYERLEQVDEVPASPAHLERAATLVPDKDRAVLAAAFGAGAQVLITGDIKHFGALMNRTDLGLQIRTIKPFLQRR